ncbi:hypothetical protein GGX14DRAFT_391847 [Mycena pura]|uniref:Uncharacterized protein n=1 Tax=Mycena pura TaxID=153505 RepID=A0AAD6VL27_9AGAR|nr:hypothetical protein GGX14DRAFT_391847 [Mycena pura]
MYESSQLLCSLLQVLLASISLIPNHAIRFATLAVSLVMGLVYIMYVKYPSTQLAQLEAIIEKTEQAIPDAGAYCCMGPFILAEANLRLLEVKRSASLIRCHILESHTSIWKKYYRLSRDISSCTQVISKVLIAVQLIVEADQQRKYAADIHAARTALTRDGHYLSRTGTALPVPAPQQLGYRAASFKDYCAQIYHR